MTRKVRLGPSPARVIRKVECPKCASDAVLPANADTVPVSCVALPGGKTYFCTLCRHMFDVAGLGPTQDLEDVS